MSIYNMTIYYFLSYYSMTSKILLSKWRVLVV
jgi:hypothetical protein